MIPQTRTISYTYDGLQRLTGAAETPGTTYAYTYDLAGNRTEVRENGALVANLSYNDANQVIGWSYDAAGNLLSDGTSSRSYDALNRLVAQDSTSYASNGDGVLVGDGTTTYAQDLAAPLSQVLSDGTANYVYGHDRLRALNGPWYVGDALGSVRQTLDDAGAVLANTNYDPWGTPQGALVGPFGFTGELHSAGQVYLRARWYAPGQGRFVSEDPFAGFPELPYSLHAYQYAYSNPVRWTDPSGMVAHNGVDSHTQPKTDIALSKVNAMPEEVYNNDVPLEERLTIPICPMETGIDWEARWDEWKVKAHRVIDVYRDNIAVGINSIEEVARDFVDGSLLPATKEAFRQAARTIDDPLLAGLYNSLGDMMTTHVISNLANAPIWLELNVTRTMLLVQVRQQRDRVHLYWIMGRGDPPLPGREFFVKGYLWSQAYCDVFEGCVAVTPFYLR